MELCYFRFNGYCILVCLAIFFGPSFVWEDSATGFTIYKHKNEAEVEKEVRSPQCATMLQPPPPRSSPIPHPHVLRDSSREKKLTVFFKDLVAKCTNVCVTSASTLIKHLGFHGPWLFHWKLFQSIHHRHDESQPSFIGVNMFSWELDDGKAFSTADVWMKTAVQQRTCF